MTGRRILVIGSGGAGKSTFASHLGKLTGLPVIHLDRHHWRAQWSAPSPEEWEATVAGLIALDSWIMDGNYADTFAIRFAAADSVIFLDYSRWICAARALKRIALSPWAARPDMAEGCHERFNWEFLRWIWDFPKHTRPLVMGALSNHAHLELFHVPSPRHLPRVTQEIVNRLRDERT